MNSVLSHRPATAADVALLAEMNRQLIADEGRRNPMTLAELEARMRAMLAENYHATLFLRDGEPVAYALWRGAAEHVSLRHFFVARGRRRQGVGRAALRLLMDEVWPAGKRIRVEVLVANRAGLAFWRAVGFADYLIGLELEC